MRVPELGAEGQQRLKDARVLVVGAGGLGGHFITFLVRAGVGKVLVVDPDKVEASNLHRQVLYSMDHIGRPKAGIAEVVAGKFQRDSNVEGMTISFDTGTGPELVEDIDLVLDATDTTIPRNDINLICTERGIPWVWTAVYGTYGHAMGIIPGTTPCFHCITLPEANVVPPCGDRILPTTLSMAGAISCTMAVQIITGSFIDGSYGSRFVSFDAWNGTIDKVPVIKRPGCPVCGGTP